MNGDFLRNLSEFIVRPRIYPLGMRDQPFEPRGCLAFLFGFGGSRAAGSIGATDPKAGEEGNYRSGPGGHEGMGYADGCYVAGKS